MRFTASKQHVKSVSTRSCSSCWPTMAPEALQMNVSPDALVWAAGQSPAAAGFETAAFQNSKPILVFIQCGTPGGRAALQLSFARLDRPAAALRYTQKRAG